MMHPDIFGLAGWAFAVGAGLFAWRADAAKQTARVRAERLLSRYCEALQRRDEAIASAESADIASDALGHHAQAQRSYAMSMEAAHLVRKADVDRLREAVLTAAHLADMAIMERDALLAEMPARGADGKFHRRCA